MSRIPVLFIAATPRSGSTLLERVIGSFDGFCPLGEAQFIWDRSFRDNQLCGCGAPFHECGFWTTVSQRAFETTPQGFDSAPLLDQKEELEKRYVPWLSLMRSPTHDRRTLELFGESLVKLYRAILEVSGDDVVIDSSKEPQHARILAALPEFELHVVHMVRDPRAVTFSWRRSKMRPEIHWKQEEMPRASTAKAAANWLIQNTQLARLSKQADSYSRIRYEDFVQKPQETLMGISEPFPQMREFIRDIDGGSIELEPAHTVSGNPMRFQHGKVDFALDDEWQRTMAQRDRLTVSTICLPLLSRYGYPLHTTEAPS